ncbi:RNA polymerase II degradation factor 1 [Drosophila subobscura]|uniref:RNA polymerase II degradation factor 1 n=1 Tax=Drosophila subobscura TaxID=7241 RepID=UPI00155AD42E|nr:RNA polymerase II degradation factor 1 [Drosophila subobscura]
MAKFVLCLCLALALAVSQAQPQAAVTESPIMAEQSTESPIADMALIEDAPMAPKSPTEKPPVVVVEAMEQPKAEEPKAAAQPHTVADFIIHPLIAFKPRQAAFDELQGKQAGNAGASPSPASPGTWLFGMNPAQGLGSSFSTLAGSVSGWFNDRLAAAGQQLPGLVDTPVRESTTTSSTTSSTTTQRPDIVVRVQQRPQRGQRPANGNRNGNGNRRQRPNRFNDRPNNSNNNNNNNRLDDSFEDDYYDEDDYFQGNRFDEEFDDEEADDLALNDEQSLEQFDEEDDEQQSVEQQQQKRRPQQQQKRRKSQQAAGSSSQRKKVQEAAAAAPAAVASPAPTKRRQQQAQSKPQKQQQQQQEDDDDEDIEDDDDEEEDSIDDDSDEEEQQQQQQQHQFAAQPEPAFFGQSGTRRSQNQPNFIQRGQQSLISQIRQFTRGQSPAELGTKLRRTSQSGGSSSSSLKARRPQQTTLLVNRNGQTLYVAPELLNLGPAYPYAYVPSQAKKQRVPVSAYPQPPLTVPIRRQGRPTQYITIPWSQLGLSPPDQQSMVSLAEGIQAQPLILNIPQSAINPVQQQQHQQQKKKKRPQLTASAVPLLAEASLMDIFQPPQIPPSRTGSANKPSGNQPVLIAAKPVKAGSNSGAALLPTRIRPGTIVEKAPAMPGDSELKPQEASEQKEQEMKMPLAVSTELPQANNQDQEFILVGDDDEPGLSRHVQPAYGDARYVSYGDFHPYFDLLHQNRRFALRKSGRALEPHTAEGEEIKEGEKEHTKEEPIKETAKEEPIKEEPIKEEPIKAEPIKEEPIKEEPIKEEPIKAEPIKAEPIKAEPIKAEPSKEQTELPSDQISA